MVKYSLEMDLALSSKICQWKVTADKGKRFKGYICSKLEIQVYNGPCESEREKIYLDSHQSKSNRHSCIVYDFHSQGNVMFISTTDRNITSSSLKSVGEDVMRIEALECNDDWD